MTAFKTTSMRIRGTSVEELEEAGLATDGLIESTAKLQSQIKALSGVDIMIDSETYKSTYQIMLEIAQVWDRLSDINQAALLEALAGKRNSQVLMSVIQNLDDLTGSYEAAQNAAGAMEEANAIAMDTITGKTKALSASWQELSGNLLNSDVVKMLLDAAKAIVEMVNAFITMGDGFFAQMTMWSAVLGGIIVMIPALVGGIEKLKVAYAGLAARAAEATVAQTAFGKLAALSAPQWALIVGALSLAAAGISVWYKAWKRANPTLDELKEKTSAAKSSLEALRTELATNNDRILELEALKLAGSSTLVDEHELELLREENRLLAEQKKLLEDDVYEAESAEASKASAEVNDFFTKSTARIWNDDDKVRHEISEGTEYEEFLHDLNEYKEAQEDLIEATENADEEAIRSATERRDALRQTLDGTLGKMQNWLPSLDMSDAVQAQQFKDLQSAIDEYIATVGDADSKSSLFKDIWNRPEWTLATTALTKLANSGDLTYQSLVDLQETNPLVGQLLAILSKFGLIDLTNLSAFTNSIKNIPIIVQPAVSSLTQMVESIEGSVSVLSSAQKDMNELGMLSVDTLKKITDEYPSLKKYLIQTASGYKLTTGALDDFMSAQRSEYVNTFNEAKQAAVERINQCNQETAAINDSTEAIKKKLLWSIQAQKMADIEAKQAKLGGDPRGYSEASLRMLGYLDESNQVKMLRESYNQLLEAEKALGEWDALSGNMRATYVDKSTSESDPYKERIEKEIKIYQHKREMDAVTDEEYYNFLKLKLAEYEQYATKYEEEIWDLKQEIFNGQREMLDDWVDDQQKAAERVAMTGNIEGQLDIYRGVIDRMKKELDEAYTYGLDANSDYVQNLEAKIRDAAKSILDITKSVFDDFISYADDFNRWDNIGEDLDISKIEMLRAKMKSIQKLLDDGTISWEEYAEAYQDAAKNLYDAQKESIETIIDLTMEMIEQEKKDEVEALEDQLDTYDKLIEAKKKLLEETKDEADHEQAVAELVEEIAELQNNISKLSMDDSREAAAKKLELEKELRDKNKELADLQNDYALDKTIETLDKSVEAKEDATEAEVKAIEESIDTWVKKYKLAIQRIDDDWDDLYDDLLAYQEEYRDSIDGVDSFKTAWQNVEDTVSDVNANISSTITSTIRGIEDLYHVIENVGLNPGMPDLDANGEWTGTISGGGNASHSSGDYSHLISKEGRSIVQQMYNNSLKAAANPGDTELRAKLNQQNYDLAADYWWATGDQLHYNAPSGTWHIGDSYNDPFLYEVYGLKKYHTGGVVGETGAINDEEVFAILKRGELVFNDEQKAQLKKILHSMFSMIGTLTSFGTYAMKVPAMHSPAAGDTFAPKFEIHIAHNGSMSDRDARRYGDAIGDAALEKLRVAFSKRGIR